MRLSMEKPQDLTSFWLEWKETCAIDLCKDPCVQNVRQIANKIFNKRIKFTQTLKIKNNNATLKGKQKQPIVRSASEYIDLAGRLGIDGNPDAFEILEIHLYDKQTINGKAFKSYLFEDIATRDGGIAQNLVGYLLKRTIADIAKNSGGKVCPVDEVDFCNKNHDENSAEENTFGNTEESVFCNEVRRSFRKSLEEKWTSFEKAEKVALVCMLYEYPSNSPEVVKMAGTKKSNLYNKRTRPQMYLNDFFTGVLKCSFDDLRTLLKNNVMHEVIYDMVKNDKNCEDLLEYINVQNKKSGKNKK